MSRRRTGLALLALMLAVPSFSLLQSFVIPVIAELQMRFDTDQATASWVLTGYGVSAAICTPIIGRLGDGYGRKKVLLISLSVVALGCVVAGLATDIQWLLTARVLQGAGAGIIPLAFGIASTIFGSRVPSVLGLLWSLTSLMWGVGILAAGPIVHALGFQWLFWVPLIVTVAAGVLAAIGIPRDARPTRVGLPIGPAVLLAAWLVPLLLAISQGNSWGWGSPVVIALLAGTAVVFALWLWAELHVRVPMIDVRMLRRRGIWTSNTVAFMYGVVVFSIYGFLPQFAQAPSSTGYGFGLSISESAQLLLALVLTQFPFSLAAPTIARRLGSRWTIALGCVVIGSACLVLSVWPDRLWLVFVCSALIGAGSGLTLSPVAAVVIAAAPPEQTGEASGMNTNLRTVGGSVGVAVMVAILTSHTLASGLPSEGAVRVSFLALTGAMVLACVAALVQGGPRTPESVRGTALLPTSAGATGDSD